MKYLYELIGTLFLVLTVGMTVLQPNGAGVLAPLAIGAVLAAMVYAGGHISGAHYNPAVSLAMYIRKKLSLKEMGLYWVSQLIGATLAAIATNYLKGVPEQTFLMAKIPQVLLVEFLFTFALAFVVLNVATSKGTKGNSFFGLAIGLIIVVGAYAVGPISGAAFNPAVALGLAVMTFLEWSSLWIYIVSTFAGALVASIVFLKAHKE